MRVLIIGELNGQIGAASKIARDRGAGVSHAADADSALAALRGGNGADLILCDVRQDIGGLIAMLESERFSVPVVACGIENDAGAAVAAIKSGAREYIPLPPDAKLIAAVLEAIAEERHAVIYASPQMAELLRMAEQVAGSDASILLTGESGTGKEVLARFIHRKSRRKDKQFISINCAAIPENLLESELFGHEKGAFTGAVARRIGKFEEAGGGTLLLDEISEMPVGLQAKLLRAIQEKEIERVGGGKPVRVDLRIIATSNRNLPEEVRKGRFREDLYFRLNVISLRIPPLRERLEDIKPIAEHFAEKYSEANGLPVRKIEDGALRKMQRFAWPGNVRELENAMHRAVLLARGSAIDENAIVLSNQFTIEEAQPMTMTADNALMEAATASAPSRRGRSELVGRTVATVERDLILDTLDYCLGNRTHAANILGISIRTLRNKLKQYGEAGEHIPPHGGEAGAR